MPHIANASQSLVCLLCAAAAACAADAPAPSAPPPAVGGLIRPTDRVVFVGDSITGLGERMDGGFVRLMREALKAARGIEPTLVALGASGHGVGGWLSVEQRSQTTNFCLDVPGVVVRTNLDAGADVVVIMLGMNDTLSPTINSDDKSLEDWIGQYRRLVDRLRQRTRARTIALATVTMAPEDPASPMNRWHERMNRRLEALGREIGSPVLPAAEESWAVQREGRAIDPGFHATYDFVHLNSTGNLGVAIGMLKGLGESAAAEWLRREKLEPLWQAARQRAAGAPPAPAAPPPGWLVGTGFTHVWRSKEFDPAAARLPVEDLIEQGKDFTGPVDIGQGRALTWRPYVPSVDYTGGASPASVDFYALLCPRPFEGAYAARWIHSDRERPAKLRVYTLGFTADIHAIAWLNGRQVFCGEAPFGTNRAVAVDATLRKGWNTLVFKSNHRAWLWQTSVDLQPADAGGPGGLRFAVQPPRD